MGNPSSNNSSILLITPLHIQHPSAKMDNAAAAVSKLFGAGSTTNDAEQPTSSTPSTTTKSTTQDVDVDVDADTTVDAKVNPAFEHTHVKKAHETREQTFVEKEKQSKHHGVTTNSAISVDEFQKKLDQAEK